MPKRESIPRPPALPAATQLAAGLIALFDDLYDTLFWIKDRHLRILAINPAFAQTVNRPTAQIIGKTDADLYFPELARVFMADDRRVIDTGLPIHRKFELLANRFGAVEWRSTTKLPLVDKQGRVVGTTGISRPLNTQSDPLPAPYAAFAHIVEYARSHLAGELDVPTIARHAGMSVATLARRFREHMRLTPGEFVSQLRIARACHLLTDTPLNVAEVAAACGYDNAAAFSRAFRRQVLMSPTAYREQTAG
jgi:AraC-like DNA-binding protein